MGKGSLVKVELFKGEYIYWMIFCFTFVFSVMYLFGFIGVLMAIGLFGLIGMVLINLKCIINILETQKK